MSKTEWPLEQRLSALIEAQRRLFDESTRQREAARHIRSTLHAAVGASRRLTGGGTSSAGGGHRGKPATQ